jgi:hypothetical protein
MKELGFQYRGFGRGYDGTRRPETQNEQVVVALAAD